ncbi:hypothetical protein B0H17DRAFT_1213910 [Mycena rosella]|uniref:Uncharacterized protein n=1 Tax=Mycena rosella TaxID=1033263 RepID=A0AAD7CP46_MYCRO|nr:hypothetical protein B0H17DRAFT_1213910 [Mycena rosella]
MRTTTLAFLASLSLAVAAAPLGERGFGVRRMDKKSPAPSASADSTLSPWRKDVPEILERAAQPTPPPWRLDSSVPQQSSAPATATPIDDAPGWKKHAAQGASEISERVAQPTSPFWRRDSSAPSQSSPPAPSHINDAPGWKRVAQPTPPPWRRESAPQQSSAPAASNPIDDAPGWKKRAALSFPSQSA